MIDHSRKLIFIHIARTGGSSIETALVGKDWWLIDPSTKHLSAQQSRTLYGEYLWERYTTFSVVRNPWDRVISMWHFKAWSSERVKALGFTSVGLREFIRELRPVNSETYNSLHYHQILDLKIDCVLRYERLAEDFTQLLESRGHTAPPLPHRSKRNGAPFVSYYTPETAALVAEIWRGDIEAFGYGAFIKNTTL